MAYVMFLVLSLTSQDQEANGVLFLGDSLTAGFGIDISKAFPSLIQDHIDRENWTFQVINAGVSGDTTAGGLRRLSWSMKTPLHTMVLLLGANDGLRGLSVDHTADNLDKIIRQARATFPDLNVVIGGMKVPPNMGPQYEQRFQEVFKRLAREHEAVLVPFLLEGVAGNPELNLPDGIHPTEEGHRIISEHLWSFLRPVLASK